MSDPRPDLPTARGSISYLSVLTNAPRQTQETNHLSMPPALARFATVTTEEECFALEKEMRQQKHREALAARLKFKEVSTMPHPSPPYPPAPRVSRPPAILFC